MARALRETPPSSSVARLLDSAAAGRALAPLASDEAVPSYSAVHTRDNPPAGSPRNKPRLIKREFVLTRETDAVLEALLQMFRQTTGTRLTASHVVRALLAAAEHSADEIRRSIATALPLCRHASACS